MKRIVLYLILVSAAVAFGQTKRILVTTEASPSGLLPQHASRHAPGGSDSLEAYYSGPQTNSAGAEITVATTNETSTSETEVMTAGAVARHVAGELTTFTNLVWVALEKDDYDFTQADTFTVHTGTWTSFDISDAVDTNHNIVAIMIEQRARASTAATAFGTKPSSAAAAQRNTVMCPVYTTAMMIFSYGVVWLDPGDPWTMYYYSNLTGTSGSSRLAWLTIYGYWHEVTINE